MTGTVLLLSHRVLAGPEFANPFLRLTIMSAVGGVVYIFSVWAAWRVSGARQDTAEAKVVDFFAGAMDRVRLRLRARLPAVR